MRIITKITVALSFAAMLLSGAEHRTRNVIIVTADGLRWQDLFTGIDAGIMNEKKAGMEEPGAKELRAKLWKETPEARREALMPFFWKELVPRGVVFGDLTKGSSARVTNIYRVSYPGYSELLTGRAQDDVITGNDPIQNPTPTILEVVRQRLRLSRPQVALFGTWDVFNAIGEHTPGSVYINAGPARIEDPEATPRTRELSETQFDAMVSWSGERHDYFTFELALEHLRHAKPRLMHIAFGETDDWAHNRRYDRVLTSIQYFDRSLRKLWATIESMPEYRGRTTLIVTCDHGRGATLSDYGNHGMKVEGANQTWIAVIGPDTPAIGEAVHVDEVLQRDVAPTVLELMGIDPASYQGVLGKVIRSAISK
jgi:hypothetical protein